MIRADEIDQMITDGVTWPEAFMVVGGIFGVAAALFAVFWGISRL